ncbi:uncharacterized protein LOC142633002 [Castanea sativa]|uniref:uncharacterized protein LOC142633002 n=1 Tax=Castanea sativa TaxID=21020 RepID=UPI003F64FAFA
MAEASQGREESVGSQRENQTRSMQHKNGRQHTPSVVVELYHSDRASGRRLDTEGQVSRDDELQQMQLEIDYLHKRLKWRKRDSRSPSYSSSDSSEERRGGDDHQASKTDPVKHVSHFNQKMTVHSNNEALMCKVFPSSLGLVAMRWFDTLEEGSLRSFEELTRAFGAWFITCSRVPKPLNALLSMAIREGETLKTYSDRYWETYNEIDGDVEDVAIRTFKLMDCIDKYKRVEDDQIQTKGKAKLIPEKRDLRGMGYQGNHPRRDFPSHPLPVGTPLVNSLFKEPIHQILEKIRHETYFRLPNKISGDASLRNQSLHCHYHQDKGHTTEECRTLHDHLNQLARARKLNHFLSRPEGQFGHQGTKMYYGNTPRPALGTINVILAQPRRGAEEPSRVMSVHGGFGNEAVKGGNQLAKRMRFSATPVLGFSEEDKEGTCQPHDDALVVTIRIGGYDVKRVLVDDGSGAKIMYDSPLVGFDGKPMISQGMIRLPMQVEDEEVYVNFIVVRAYSPYMAILARP